MYSILVDIDNPISRNYVIVMYVPETKKYIFVKQMECTMHGIS